MKSTLLTDSHIAKMNRHWTENKNGVKWQTILDGLDLEKKEIQRDVQYLHIKSDSAICQFNISQKNHSKYAV